MSPRRSEPRFADDFDADQPVTEALNALGHQGAWDGHIEFRGVSDIGVMPAPDTRPLAVARSRPAQLPTFRALQPDPPQRLSQSSDRAPIAEDTARGWAHMFTVRCEYPAGTSGDQAIPCDREYRDDQAGSYPALYRSAWDNGWRYDKLRRWACPDHAKFSGDYQALYPVTHWHPDAAYHDQCGDEAGAHRLRVIAENTMTRDVLDRARQGKHRARVA